MTHDGWKWVPRGLVLWGTLSLLVACGGGGGGDGGGPVTPQVGKVTVSGQVTGSGPIQDVAVSAGGISDTTDANGLYSLADVPVPDSGRLVLTYKKAGYGTFQRSLPVEAGKSYAVAATLAQYNVSELTNVDPTTGQTLQGVDPATSQVKVKIDVPAGSLQSGGSAVTGPVNVNMVHGDPSTTQGRAVFPGDYMAAPAAGAAPNTELESVAFAEVKLTDAAGAELSDVTFAQPATLTLRLPDEFQTGGAKAGTYVVGDPVRGFIEWWSYDETTGAWLEEDADADATNGVTKAEVIDDGGVLYARGKVTHFSWWNADRPMNEHACLCATVRDGAGAPMPGVEIVAEGVSYNGTSYPALTAADGKACVNVKRSTSEAAETVKVKARAGNVDFLYDVTASTEGDVDAEAVTVWTTQGSTRDNSGTCYSLANAIQVAFNGRITGTVTYENSGLPVADFTILSSFGPKAVTAADGTYSLKVPVGVSVLLFAPGLQSRSATVTDEAVPVVVDFALPNRIPTITSLTRSPETTPVAPETAVTFAASASDPDGDAITYSWAADVGSPASGAGATFAWTAPATATTATVTVTVTDAKGASASQSLPVVVGGGTGGTSLKFTVRDDTASGLPVAGVYVILHAADGTVERTIQTGVDGIADFGDIGRARATVTIADETLVGGTTERDLTTFVEALVGDVVYYLDNGRDDGFCQTPSATIQVPTTGYPGPGPNGGFAQLQPVFSFSFVNDTFTDVPVCPDALQTDGSLSLLASAFQFDQVSFTQNLVKYGFLLDQTVTNGASYTVAFDRDPVLVGWSATGGSVNAVMVDATRRGVDYQLAQFFQEPGMGGGPVTSGTLSLPTAFPADYFWVEAEKFDFQTPDGTSLGVSKKYLTLPTTLTVPMPDYSFTAFSHDTGTNRYSWTLTGSSPADAVLVSFFQSGTDTFAEWEAIMAPGATGWTPVTLPAPVASWIDPSQASERAVMVVDFDIATGFDGIWNYVILGNDPDEGSNQMLRGYRRLATGTPTTDTPTMGRVAGRAAGDAAPAEPTRPDPLKGLRGLLRR